MEFVYHPVNERKLEYENPSVESHLASEGIEGGTEDYAETLVKMPYSAIFELKGEMSEGGYLNSEDLILLSDRRYHEHEFIHRLSRIVQSGAQEGDRVPDEGQRIVDEELAETYGVPLSWTEAYLVDDYDEVSADILEEVVDESIDVEVEDGDIYSVLKLDDPLTGRERELEEMVAHYLTEDLSRKPIEMMFGYGVMPWTFKEGSRALERLDKDSEFDRGVMARRALGYDSIHELVDEAEDMEEVRLRERSELNGELMDESRTGLLLRSIRNLL